MQSGHIDASKWAKSVGLNMPCIICERLIVDSSKSKTTQPIPNEEIASLSMAILSTIKRKLVNESTFCFEFKSTWCTKPNRLQARFVRSSSGSTVLIVRKST